MSNNVSTAFPSTTSLIGILFLGLKLTGCIAWPWVWVLAPFWIPLGIFFCLVTFFTITKLILLFIE